MNYATVEEADSYIGTHYLPNTPDRLLWDAMDSLSKEILLTQAHEVINSLPFTGRKYSELQDDAFPRRFCSGFTQTDTIPKEVKSAEIELAYSLSDSSKADEAAEYRRMIDYGVASYSVGNFSESLLTYGKGNLKLNFGLVSDKAQKLLSPWLSGGYSFG